MNSLTKAIIVIAAILGIGAGLVFWQAKYGGHGSSSSSFNKITKEDMALLLADADPMQLQAIGEDPEAKKKIAENLRQLLAVAAQAKKDGLADDPNIKNELESIRLESIAKAYDKKINSDKGPMPPFGFVSEEQVNATIAKPGFEDKFKNFLDSKIALAKESGRFPKDKELTEEELKSVKEDFAKIMFYNEEAEAKKGELGADFAKNLDLQVKLQQAQFLASRYAQKTLTEKAKVTDEEVNQYIAEHPEYNTAEKKKQAEEILARAKSGEDFAKLADEFSQDPGTKGKGGLYEDVTMGKMVKPFEEAALALEPGQVSPNLVESPFGYHIIRLEKKGEMKGADGQTTPTYNVRHILITTTMKDPKNPFGREMPINEMVKGILGEEKQKKILDDIVKNNPVEVPEDFEIPKPSEEDLKKMEDQRQQMMMPGGPDGMPMTPPPGGPDAPQGPKEKTPPAKKPEPKK